MQLIYIRFSLFNFLGQAQELPALVEFFQREATSLATRSYDRRQLYDVLNDIALASDALARADRLPPLCTVCLRSYLTSLN